MNMNSAYIDGGAVYGSNPHISNKLRAGRLGLMKTNSLGPTLPTRREVGLKGKEKYEGILVGGDPRATTQPGLTSLYSLFLAEHNRAAISLRAVDSSLNDEQLYQWSRIIVTAELQNIVQNEFLPAVLGTEWMTKLSLPADLTGDTSYDSTTDPGIYNEFATVAFRFGHALIPNFLKVSNFRNQTVDSSQCSIKENYFNFEKYVLGTDGKAWQNGLVGSRQTDNNPADSITNYLFCKDCKRATGFGQDLFARNIQRGRDHGLPGYIKFREFCKLSVPSGWSDRPEEISKQNWQNIMSVYKTVEDIDPYVGGMVEEPVPRGVVGPTFACIISKQFENIKDGDRFFFTHKQRGSEVGLDTGFRAMIRKRTLHDLMCDNIPIDELPLNIFDTSSGKVKCSENNKLNFITAEICLKCAGDKSGIESCKDLPCPGNKYKLNNRLQNYILFS